MDKCRHCGSSINAGFKICPHCSGDQRPSGTEQFVGCLMMIVFAVVVIIGLNAWFPDAMGPDHNQLPKEFDVARHCTDGYKVDDELFRHRMDRLSDSGQASVVFKLDSAPPEHRQAVADFITKHRPDLADAVANCLEVVNRPPRAP